MVTTMMSQLHDDRFVKISRGCLGDQMITCCLRFIRFGQKKKKKKKKKNVVILKLTTFTSVYKMLLEHQEDQQKVLFFTV